MSDLQQAMAEIISVFHKYSGKEGDKYTLTKLELKELLKNELPEIMGANTPDSEVERIMRDLDSNKDGVVDFQEFVSLVAVLTMLCNDFFQKR